MAATHKVYLAGFLITIVGAILFSTKAIIVKTAFAHISIDALTLLTVRMLFALPFYLIVAAQVTRKEGNVRLTKKEWLQVIVLGLFGYYLSSLFDFMGLKYISAGLERLILFLYPSFAVIINAAFFRQPLKKIQVWSLLLTYLGIGIAYFGELGIDAHNPHFLAGSMLIFACSITYAIYISGSGHMISKIGANKFTAYAMLAATVGIFIHFLARGNFGNLPDARPMWLYGVSLAVVATVLPTFLISAGMKRIGSGNVAIISSVGPVSTILQAHFFLGEPIFIEQIIGTILVIAGVLLIGLKKNAATQDG